MPTFLPAVFMMWAIMREVVVFPLVPVTATIGTRDGLPGGKSMSITARRRGAGVPRWGGCTEARTGIDLHDRPALLAHGAGDVSGDEVDAGHVEPDDHRRLAGDLDVVGVDVVGAVDGGAAGAHVAGQLELDEAALLRHVVQSKLLLRQHLDGLRVDGDAGQDLLVADAPRGSVIRDLHQLGDGVLAVADDVAGTRSATATT